MEDEEQNHLAWISDGVILQNETKPNPNAASQCSFAADGNEAALWQKLVDLNTRQYLPLSETLPITSPFEKENDFVRMILTIEGDKLSKELFSLLFDLV